MTARAARTRSSRRGSPTGRQTWTRPGSRRVSISATARYTSLDRPDRVSLYDGFAGARFGEQGQFRVRAGHMWLPDLGTAGALAGGLFEYRQAPAPSGGVRFMAGAFSGAEPLVYDTGYATDVRKYGGYAGLQRGFMQRHVVGLHAHPAGRRDRAQPADVHQLHPGPVGLLPLPGRGGGPEGACRWHGPRRTLLLRGERASLRGVARGAERQLQPRPVARRPAAHRRRAQRPAPHAPGHRGPAVRDRGRARHRSRGQADRRVGRLRARQEQSRRCGDRAHHGGRPRGQPARDRAGRVRHRGALRSPHRAVQLHLRVRRATVSAACGTCPATTRTRCR